MYPHSSFRPPTFHCHTEKHVPPMITQFLPRAVHREEDSTIQNVSTLLVSAADLPLPYREACPSHDACNFYRESWEEDQTNQNVPTFLVSAADLPPPYREACPSHDARNFSRESCTGKNIRPAASYPLALLPAADHHRRAGTLIPPIGEATSAGRGGIAPHPPPGSPNPATQRCGLDSVRNDGVRILHHHRCRRPAGGGDPSRCSCAAIGG
jgi:hypothetical protein